MRDSRSLESVDAALEAARREARDARLPSALRARILAAARPAAAPVPRGRLVDFALRAAAVAAVLTATFLALPESLQAADLGPRPLVELNDRIASSVAERLPRLGFDAVPLSGLADDSSLPLGAAAVVLVGAGLWLVRTERRW